MGKFAGYNCREKIYISKRVTGYLFVSNERRLHHGDVGREVC